jgi:cell wall-associated NlpC family hydrolase
MTQLEKRTHAYRVDLADERLRGRVEAQHFVTGIAHQITSNIATLYRTPDSAGRQETQALFGETCLVFDQADGFAFVQLDEDGYVGYLKSGDLTAELTPATHRISVPSTFRYPAADLKTQPVTQLLQNSKIAVSGTEGNYLALHTGGFVFANHVVALETTALDFVAEAERFLHTPYLWGGKSIQGIDCSGLVQLALQATGRACPRDADMQEAELGQSVLVNDIDHLQRGDLVFWPGHVGIMANPTMLLHANGYHMQTVLEPLNEAIDRIAKTVGPPSAIKRL